MITKTPAKGKVTNATAQLKRLAKDIKAREKSTIEDVVKIGELLREAADVCEHGEYMEWVFQEFGWSHQTALNYRNVFEFDNDPPTIKPEQIPKALGMWSVHDLNISLSALFFLAAMKKPEQQPARFEVIATALRERVNYRDARMIVEEFNEQAEADEPQAQHEGVDQVDGEAPKETPGFFTVRPPGPDNEDGPEVEYEEDEPEPSKPPPISQLLFWLRAVLRDPQTDFRPAIASLGKPDIREIVKRLQEELNKSDSISSSSVRAAADRAELKSKTH